MSTYPVEISTSRLPAKAIRKVTKPANLDRCIAGMHLDKQADLGIVWLAHDLVGDKVTGRVTLYDSAIFRRDTSLAVIAEALKQRGDWIPICWRNEDEQFAEELRKRGCKVLREGYSETPSQCETTVRKLQERLAMQTFDVLETNQHWATEYENLGFDKDGYIPQEGFPLMSATRHALYFLKSARVKEPKRRERAQWGGSVV